MSTAHSIAQCSARGGTDEWPPHLEDQNSAWECHSLSITESEAHVEPVGHTSDLPALEGMQGVPTA
eukprot:12159446-Prorocentrum_lima.AAC.1